MKLSFFTFHMGAFVYHKCFVTGGENVPKRTRFEEKHLCEQKQRKAIGLCTVHGRASQYLRMLSTPVEQRCSTSCGTSLTTPKAPRCSSHNQQVVGYSSSAERTPPAKEQVMSKAPKTRAKQNFTGEQSTPRTTRQYVRDTLPSPSSDGLGMEVKAALTQITTLLTNVVERVERVETKIQQQQSSGVSSSSSSESSPKHVPLVVRVRACICIYIHICMSIFISFLFKLYCMLPLIDEKSDNCLLGVHWWRKRWVGGTYAIFP